MKKSYKYKMIDTGKVVILNFRPPSTKVGRLYKMKIEETGSVAKVQFLGVV